MYEQISNNLHKQTLMLIWDLNLAIESKGQVDIFTPLFSLNSTETENKNWIRLDRLNHNITISSNFSSIDEFSHCKTYMINSTTNKVEDVYEGFKVFKYKPNGWIENVRFVFEIEMQYATVAEPPILWKHCTTEMKSPINTYGKSLSLETEENTQQKVFNTQGVACVVKKYETGHTSFPCGISIHPEEPSENWNLFIIMLKKEENNVLGWYYLHLISQAGWTGKYFSKFVGLIILEINELKTEFVSMSERNIAAVKSVIKPRLNPLNEQEEMQYQLDEASTYLMGYLTENNLSEITVHVGDQKIRMHKENLAPSVNGKKEDESSELKRKPSVLKKIKKILKR